MAARCSTWSTRLRSRSVSTRSICRRPLRRAPSSLAGSSSLAAQRYPKRCVRPPSSGARAPTRRPACGARSRDHRSPDRRRHRARHRADPRLGVVVLPPRDPGGTDGAGPRRCDTDGVRRVLGGPRRIRVDRPAGGSGDRPVGRPPGPGDGQRRLRDGSCHAGLRPPRRRPLRRMARRRHRHGQRVVRRRLLDTRPPVRPPRARTHHGGHPDRRLRQHGRLAVVDLAGGARRLARRLHHVGGPASRRRPAAPLVVAAGGAGRFAGRPRRCRAGGAAGRGGRPRLLAARLRVRGDVVHRDGHGGPLAATDDGRRRDDRDRRAGRRARRTRAGRRADARIQRPATGSIRCCPPGWRR